MYIPTISSYEYLLNKIELLILKPLKNGKSIQRTSHKTYYQRICDLEDHIANNKFILTRSEEADLVKLYQYNELLFATRVSSIPNKYAYQASIANRLE